MAGNVELPVGTVLLLCCSGLALALPCGHPLQVAPRGQVETRTIPSPLAYAPPLIPPCRESFWLPRTHKTVLHLRGGGEGVPPSRESTLVLFDIDGTLTAPRNVVTPDVLAFLEKLRSKVSIGVVGGSDMAKAQEQLGSDYVSLFDYAFSENGLVAFRQGEALESASLREHLGEANLRRIIDWTLTYLARLDIPVKRGTFIEFRSGLLNISPIGRNCNRSERDAFEAYDREHRVRADMVKAMQDEFGDLQLTYSVGGQISFDVFPKGWDKTYCLRHIPEETYQRILFFGDKCDPGGNDWEIFADPRTEGHKVQSPEETVSMCSKLFGL